MITLFLVITRRTIRLVMVFVALCCTRQSQAHTIERCTPEIWPWPRPLTLTPTFDLDLWPLTLPPTFDLDLWPWPRPLTLIRDLDPDLWTWPLTLTLPPTFDLDLWPWPQPLTLIRDLDPDLWTWPLTLTPTHDLDPWPWPRPLTLTLKQWKLLCNSDVKIRFLAFDLDLWPTTLTYNPKLAKVKLYLHTKYQGRRSNSSGMRVVMDGRTDRRTDGWTQPSTLSPHFAVDKNGRFWRSCPPISLSFLRLSSANQDWLLSEQSTWNLPNVQRSGKFSPDKMSGKKKFSIMSGTEITSRWTFQRCF